MDKKQCMKEIKSYFVNQNDISAVYLFGSMAKGKTMVNSDVDIGILFNESLPILSRFERKLEIANDLEDILMRSVDIVDLDSADSYLLHQIMLNKDIILERDIDRRVAFEVEKRRDYFDRKRFYDLYHQQALKRLKEKGAKHQNG